ncbi:MULTISPECIES: HAD family hydrolase [unclassified Streptomyces]|uniref:HAD family hydrolase n=1 Tax=unclassified Streptomyces TaxID=2593676 RepID=UPI002251022A|nr:MULTISPECIES: hypothetical protein [unclassified Streptomyces]MCX5063901.1 hypothetical protein [Streptomyces sp. NBC_00452]
MAEETRWPIDVMAVVSERDAYYLTHVARVRPVPDVLALARAQQGVRRLALVTGGGRATVLPTIGHLGMQELFTTLVTREDAPGASPSPISTASRSSAWAFRQGPYPDGMFVLPYQGILTGARYTSGPPSDIPVGIR